MMAVTRKFLPLVAVLALLNSGLPPDDPTVAKGLNYLRQLKTEQTYVRALQTMVLVEATVSDTMLTSQSSGVVGSMTFPVQNRSPFHLSVSVTV